MAAYDDLTTDELIEVMSPLPWCRKAETWSEADRNTPSPGALLEALVARLETFPAGPWPLTRFSGPRPQIFIAVTPKGDRYLVDHQGYDYARYVMALPENY
jgi:hypothetical protein